MKNKTINFTGYRALKSAQILSNYKETDNLIKAHENDIKKSGEGSRGGKVIGHTKSGKPIYEGSTHPSYKKFTSRDHKDAAYEHRVLGNKTKDQSDEKWYHKHSDEHLAAAKEKESKKEKEGDKSHKEDSKEAHEKRSFNESTGDEDVTGKNEKLKKAYDLLDIENDIEKAEGSRGGKVIGHTKSGKPIYEGIAASYHHHLDSREHSEASDFHRNESKKESDKGNKDKAFEHHRKALAHHREAEKKEKGEVKHWLDPSLKEKEHKKFINSLKKY